MEKRRKEHDTNLLFGLLTLGIGWAGATGVMLLGLPGGAFTGAMIAAAAARMIFPRLAEPPHRLQLVARIILGLVIGISLNAATLRALSTSLIPILLMILILIWLCVLAALVLSRRSRLPLVTSICSASPGATSVMVILAGDLGGDQPQVAAFHLFRLASVAFLIPAVVSGIAGGSAGLIAPEVAVAADPVADPAASLLLFGAGVVTAVVFLRWRVPAAEILGGMAAAAVLNSLVLHVSSLPGWWTPAAQVIIGAGIGSQMTRQSFAAIRSRVLDIFLLTSLLLLIGLILGWLLYLFTPMDLATALLGSSPGGLDIMIILATDMGADAQLVAAMHTARLVIVMVLVPFLVRYMIRFEKRVVR